MKESPSATTGPPAEIFASAGDDVDANMNDSAARKIAMGARKALIAFLRDWMSGMPSTVGRMVYRVRFVHRLRLHRISVLEGVAV